MQGMGNKRSSSSIATVEPYQTINKDLVTREVRLENLYRYLDATIYNKLVYSFDKEYSAGNEYIPLRSRRPAITYRMCKIIVDNSVSLVFGESHFPGLEVTNKEFKNSEDELKKLAKAIRLKEIMSEAATKGSVGSIAVLVKFIRNTVFLQVLKTCYMQPVFDECDNETLIKVTRKIKVNGPNLIAKGHKGIDKNKEYLIVQEWDDTEEIQYKPIDTSTIKKEDELELIRDDDRCSVHNLGFVPIVWIKNLVCDSEEIDGDCTFEAAIPAQIEIDYQLSQGGRALKYSGDPLLVIKHGTSFIADIENNGTAIMPSTEADFAAEQAKIVRSASKALELDAEGEAKLLEISGDAAKAVLEYVKELRKYALESVHANRSDPEKMSLAQSGKALEILNQPLIWLAEKLRYSYGEFGLIKVLKMIISGSKKYPIILDGKKLNFPDNLQIALKWEDFYVASAQEKQQKALMIKTYKDAQIISQETAVKAVANDFDIEDVSNEIKQIEVEKEANANFNQQENIKTQINETQNL